MTRFPIAVLLVFSSGAARPTSWSWSLKRRRREEARDWTARVARALCSMWNWSMRLRSMLLMTSTL